MNEKPANPQKILQPAKTTIEMALTLGPELECRALDERDPHMPGETSLEEVNITHRLKLFIGR